MTLALAFWTLMLIWLAVGIWNLWPSWQSGGPNLLLFGVIALLGWRVFGPPIHG